MVATTDNHALLSGTANATLIPQNPDTLLGRRETAHALTAAGYRTSPATLATKASRGGGPPFRRWGRKPLYRWGDTLDWACSQLGPPMRSTSEADAGMSGADRCVAAADICGAVMGRETEVLDGLNIDCRQHGDNKNNAAAAGAPRFPHSPIRRVPP
jgi:hypothetical protein